MIILIQSENIIIKSSRNTQHTHNTYMHSEFKELYPHLIHQTVQYPKQIFQHSIYGKYPKKCQFHWFSHLPCFQNSKRHICAYTCVHILWEVYAKYTLSHDHTRPWTCWSFSHGCQYTLSLQISRYDLYYRPRCWHDIEWSSI